MKKPRYFLDTNVLLYLADSRAPEKLAQAKRWMGWLQEHGEVHISWQVLHEFYVNAIKKFGLPPVFARRLVLHYQRLGPVDTDPALVARAWNWQDQAQVSYWDALVLAAAERAQCEFLLSEDFQDGRTYGGVTARNPFASEPGEVPT